jgi:hypothetical protein
LVSVVTSVRSLRSTRARTSFHQVVDLVARLAHLDLGVHDPGRADDLLEHRGRVLALVGAGGRETNTSCGVIERNSSKVCGRLSIALGRRKPKSTSVCLRERSPRTCPDLRDGLVRLVEKQTKSFGEVVDEAVRAGAGGAAVEDPGVVLDPVAEAHLPHHLHVVLRALAQAVRLEQLALGLELGAALVELAADLLDRALMVPSLTL